MNFEAIKKDSSDGSLSDIWGLKTKKSPKEQTKVEGFEADQVVSFSKAEAVDPDDIWGLGPTTK